MIDAKIIYISAPITGQERTAEKRFDEIEKHLLEQGYITVNPYKLNNGYNNWCGAVIAGLKLLQYCHAIYLAGGWEHSYGCKVEMDFALGAGIDILKWDDKQ